MWLQLCDVLDLPELKEDPRFADNGKRVAAREELRGILERRLATKTRAEWTALLVAAGIPAGPINSIADAFSEEQLHFCRLVEEIRHPVLGLMKQVALPLTFSDNDRRWIRRPPPVYAEHSVEILTEFGYEQKRIDHLVRDGVIYQRKN